MWKPADGCIFCGKRPVTKEDVWPTWLTQYLPRTLLNYFDSVALIRPGGTIDTTRRKWDGDPRSRRAKCVCAGCNSGWMSRLQEDTKPIVLRLVKGDSFDLSVSDQRLLAAWATMGTMTSEFFRPSTVAISKHDHLQFWKTGRPIKGWKIWIGDFERGDWPPYRVHNAWSYSSDNSILRPDTPADMQITTLVFGRLYLHVASSQRPNIVRGLAFPKAVTNMILKSIWPPRTSKIRWPPRQTMTDRDADNAAGFLFLAETGLLWTPPKKP
jgi:hypothetical protein